MMILHNERNCPLCTALNLLEAERVYVEKLKKEFLERENKINKLFGIDLA